MKLRIVALCLVIAMSSAYAQGTPQRDFAITFPNGWVQIPQDVVEAKEELAYRQVPGSTRLHWALGFQRKNKDNWFTYPYGGVEIINSGMVPESMWKNVANWSAVTSDRELQKTRQKLKSLFTTMNMQNVHYGSKTNIIWARMQATNSSIGQLNGVVGFIRTSRGYIRAYCYFLQADASRDFGGCRKIISSITPKKS